MEKLLERSYHITWNNEDEKQQIVDYLESIGFINNNSENRSSEYILTYTNKKFGFFNHNGGYDKLDISEIISQEPNYEIY